MDPKRTERFYDSKELVLTPVFVQCNIQGHFVIEALLSPGNSLTGMCPHLILIRIINCLQHLSQKSFPQSDKREDFTWSLCRARMLTSVEAADAASTKSLQRKKPEDRDLKTQQ